MTFYKIIAAALLASGLVACAGTGDDLPAETEEGLQRVSGSRVDAAYMAPGADLGQYEVLYISEVRVSFVKNWLEDQNRERRSTSNRLSQEDADRIKAAVAEDFRKIFTENLEEAGYTVIADKSGAGAEDDVLVLLPAIVDLDVAAPDTRSPGRSRTYTTTAGSMSLYMEMYDGLTSALIARVADSQSAPDYGTMQITNSVTNRAEADRMMKKWAKLLVKALDEAHGK